MCSILTTQFRIFNSNLIRTISVKTTQFRFFRLIFSKSESEVFMKKLYSLNLFLN